MLVSEGITVCREDYLDDTEPDALGNYQWNDSFYIRAFAEAERQACNRSNLIYDDSTASIVELTLVNGQAWYPLSQKITYIESVLWEGKPVIHKSKEELDRDNATWRTDTGMAGKTCYAFVRGRNIRFSPVPDATDAGETVYLEVYRLPATDVSAPDSSFEIDTEYHRDLIYHVLWECYNKRDADSYDPNKALVYRKLFEDVFGDYVSAEVRLNQFAQPKVLRARPVQYAADFTRETDSSDWN